MDHDEIRGRREARWWDAQLAFDRAWAEREQAWALQRFERFVTQATGTFAVYTGTAPSPAPSPTRRCSYCRTAGVEAGSNCRNCGAPA